MTSTLTSAPMTSPPPSQPNNKKRKMQYIVRPTNPKKMTLGCGHQPFSKREYQSTVALCYNHILKRAYNPAGLATLASMLGILTHDVSVPMFRLGRGPLVEYVTIRAKTQHDNSHSRKRSVQANLETSGSIPNSANKKSI